MVRVDSQKKPSQQGAQITTCRLRDELLIKLNIFFLRCCCFLLHCIMMRAQVAASTYEWNRKFSSLIVRALDYSLWNRNFYLGFNIQLVGARSDISEREMKKKVNYHVQQAEELSRSAFNRSSSEKAFWILARHLNVTKKTYTPLSTLKGMKNTLNMHKRIAVVFP